MIQLIGPAGDAQQFVSDLSEKLPDPTQGTACRQLRIRAQLSRVAIGALQGAEVQFPAKSRCKRRDIVNERASDIVIPTVNENAALPEQKPPLGPVFTARRTE
jgi:hypothetical protein